MTIIKEKRPFLQGMMAGPYVWQLLFFASYFLFILLYTDPRIIVAFNGVNHYSYGIEFTKEYAVSIVTLPGGGAKLVASLVVLACTVPWLGALLLTLIAWALCAAADAFAKQSAGKPLHALRYVPAILLLLIVGRYSMNLLAPVLAAFGTTLFGAQYLRAGVSSGVRRAVVFCMLTVLSYYLFSFSAVLFMALAIIGDALARRKALWIPFCAALVMGSLLATCKAYWFPFDRIFDYGAIFSVKRPLLYIYCFAPVAAALVFGEGAIFSKRKADTAGSRRVILRVAVPELVMLIVFGAVAFWTARDWTTKTARELGRVVCFNRARNWDEILKERDSFIFDDFPRYASRTALLATTALYRALYHTGRLGYDLFSFPQAASSEPLMLATISRTIFFPAWTVALDMAVDLGAANLAEKIAGEAMENMGPLPPLMYKRAVVQTAKGNTDFALVYLNKLKHMPGYRRAAGRLIRAIGDSSVARDSAVAKLRASLDTTDYVLDSAHEESMLLNLLQANPRNKMAFEYLMTYYLLTRQPGKVARNLGRLPDLGYTEVPLLYEEAMEIARRNDSSAIAALPAAQPRQQTAERCDRFIAMAADCGRGVPGAQEAVRREFGSSYFYFYTAGVITGEKQ
jgi:hypothetical protein